MTNQNASSSVISLKESFRTLAYIDRTISSLTSYLSDRNNSISIKETHFKEKSNSEAKNEELDTTTIREYPDASIVDIVYLVKNLISEKTKLEIAVEFAKRHIVIESKDNNNLTLDSAISNAKQMRELVKALSKLINIKTDETKKQGVGFRFNNEGNETSYRYDITVVKTIDFDRNIVSNNYKQLLENADKLSISIEKSMMDECVEYEFPYSIHDSVADIVVKYLDSRK
jgi:hypothetical protein